MRNDGPDTLPVCPLETAGDSMDEFDTLPAEFRSILANAPFNYATHPARVLIDAQGLQSAVEVALKNLPLHIASSAEQDYGPNHPQACSDKNG